MTRTDIFNAIDIERQYQDSKWGHGFDDRNTPNDWIAYITCYAGKAVLMPFDKKVFQTAVLKIMAICCAILEREDYAPRHYDPQ